MNPQGDPYAGQYPPPPPLPTPSNDSYHSLYVPPNYEYQQQQNYISNSPFYPNYQSSPQLHYDQHYNQPPITTTANTHYQEEEEYDPNSLEAYLRQERAAYLAQKEQQQQQQQQNQNQNQNYHSSTPQPNQVTPIQTTYQQQQQQQHYQSDTYLPKPTPPPDNESASYGPKPVYYEKRHRNSDCCSFRSLCCCYNPAMTCCSCFCMLFSLAFVAAGIALIIASRVISEKCYYQCGTLIEQAQEACGTICNSVLHDAMFYGGIAVAGLAALSVLWRIIMWTCAGCSQR